MHYALNKIISRGAVVLRNLPLQNLPHILDWVHIWGISGPAQQGNILLMQVGFDDPSGMTRSPILHKREWFPIRKPLAKLRHQALLQDALVLIVFHGALDHIQLPRSLAAYHRPHHDLRGVFHGLRDAVWMIFLV